MSPDELESHINQMMREMERAARPRPTKAQITNQKLAEAKANRQVAEARKDAAKPFGRMTTGSIEELFAPKPVPPAVPQAKPACLRSKKVAEAEARLAKLLGEPINASEPINETLINGSNTLIGELTVANPRSQTVIRKN